MNHRGTFGACGRAACSGTVIAVALVAAVAWMPARLPASGPGFSYELVTQQGWLYGSQLPGSVPFMTTTRWIHVDSVAPSILGGRIVRFRLAGSIGSRGEAGRIETRHRAGSDVIIMETPGPVFAAVAGPVDRSDPAAPFIDGSGLNLPESRLWDLVPAEPPALRAGARWEDTIRSRADRAGASQRYAAARVSVVVGDTMTANGRMWIVEDSASVEWSERIPRLDRSLDTMVVLEHRVIGTMRGRHLYDPVSRLFRFRADSTGLDGAALLLLPDGREYRVPVRFERRRRWTAYDVTARALRAREIEADRQRAGVAAAQPTALPDSARAEMGDSASTIARILSDRAGRPLSLPEWRLLVVFLADPGLAFAHGLAFRPLYTTVQDWLVSRPPAVIADTMQWPCMPSVCRALARQWDEATEPRLRDLGLVAQYVMDPSRWERILAGRAAEGSVLARRALDATVPNEEDNPVPRPGATWREWARWLGPDPAAAHRRAVILQFLLLRTGRDVVPELTGALARATSDSATFVYESLLRGLGAWRLDAETAARHLESGSPLLRDVASRALYELSASARPADPATDDQLADRVLRILLEGASEWPESPALPGGRPRLVAVPARTTVLSSSLPPATAARWAGRVPFATSEDWSRIPWRDRPPGLMLEEIRLAGPLAFVGYDIERGVEREPADIPTRSSEGYVWVLRRTPSGWVIVDAFHRIS